MILNEISSWLLLMKHQNVFTALYVCMFFISLQMILISYILLSSHYLTSLVNIAYFCYQPRQVLFLKNLHIYVVLKMMYHLIFQSSNLRFGICAIWTFMVLVLTADIKFQIILRHLKTTHDCPKISYYSYTFQNIFRRVEIYLHCFILKIISQFIVM